MPDHIPAILGPATFSRKILGTPSFQLDFASPAYYVIEFATDPKLFDPANAENRTSTSFHQTPLDQLLGPAKTTVFVISLEVWNSLRGASTLFYRVVTSSSSDKLTDIAQSASPTDGQAIPHIRLTDDVSPPQPRVASNRRYSVPGSPY